MTKNSFNPTAAYRMFLIGTDDTDVALHNMHLMTPGQFCALYHGQGSINWAKTKLRVLEKYGYVQILGIRGYPHRPPHYVVLAKEGIKFIRKASKDIADSARASKEIHSDQRFVEHSLGIGDVIISAELLKRVEQSETTYYLESFVHERTLKHKPFMVTIQDKQVKLEPDALLTFCVTTSEGERKIPTVLEHDCGTEGQEAFRWKIRKYATRLETHPCPVLFTTFKGEKHVTTMRERTRAELASTGDIQTVGQFFYFANLTEPLDPERVWLNSCWYSSEGQEPIALLPTLYEKL